MNLLEESLKEQEEMIIRYKLFETIKDIYILVNDKDFDSKNKFNKENFKNNLILLMNKERNLTIDNFSRHVGVAVSFIHAVQNTQFKEDEIITTKTKDNTIINIIGYKIECFIAPYDVPSLKFDCKIIKANKKIAKRIKEKVNISQKEQFQTPFLKNYMLLVIEELLFNASANIIMPSHSFFTEYLQGMSVLNNITTEAEEKSIARVMFSEIYEEFDLIN